MAIRAAPFRKVPIRPAGPLTVPSGIWTNTAPFRTTARAEATCASTPIPPRKTGSRPPSRWMSRSREREVNVEGPLPRNHARGSAGLADTLEALNERRVEALLVQRGFRVEGYASPSADFLSVEGGVSPRGDELQKRDDVIESALESALEQSAEVVVVRHHPDLEALGSIGAVLRY